MEKFSSEWRSRLAIFACSVLPTLMLNGGSFWLMDDCKQLLRGQGAGWRSLIDDSFGATEHLFRPLVVLLSRIDGMIWGVHGWGFRVTNLFLFAISCQLVYSILKKITSRDTAIFAAIIYAIHPIQVGTVVWLSGRVDLLPAVLIFAGINSLMGSKGYARALVGNAFFVLALLAKETAAMFPFALFVADTLMGVPRRDAIKRAMPSFAICLIYWALRYHYHFMPGTKYYDPATSLGNPLTVARDLMSLALNVIYIFAPLKNPMEIMRLEFPNANTIFGTLFNSTTIGPIVFMATGTIFVFGFAYLAISRQSDKRAAIFSIIWLFIFIAPTLHVLANMAGSRYFHVSMLGGAYIAAIVIEYLGEKSGEKRRRAVKIAFLLIFLAVNFTEQVLWKNAFDRAERITIGVVEYSRNLPGGSTIVACNLPEYSDGGRLIYPGWDRYSLPLSAKFLGAPEDVTITVDRNPNHCAGLRDHVDVSKF